MNERADTGQSLRRRRSATPLGALVGASIDPILAQRGFAGGDLMLHWPEIAGPGLDQFCRPISLTWPQGGKAQGLGATLTLACLPAFALDVQQLAPVLIERINRRLGWSCVTRIAIRQRPVTPPARPEAPLAVGPEDRDAAGRIVAGIEADDLREALTRLGAGVLAETRRRALRR